MCPLFMFCLNKNLFKSLIFSFQNKVIFQFQFLNMKIMFILLLLILLINLSRVRAEKSAKRQIFIVLLACSTLLREGWSLNLSIFCRCPLSTVLNEPSLMHVICFWQLGEPSCSFLLSDSLHYKTSASTILLFANISGYQAAGNNS